MKNWLQIKAQGKLGEIFIYGEITDWKWLDEDVTPNDIKNELAKLKDVDSINVYVNSPGGNVFAGVAIYNALKRFNKPITAYVDGIAASIASLIILAADKVVMPLNAMLMIHNPWSCICGSALELRDHADKLEQITDSVLITTYQAKTGITKEKLKDMLDKETWLSAEEAVALGFADEMEAEQQIAASYVGGNIKFKDTEIALDNFKAFPRAKFSEHTPKQSTFKQRHRHNMNMLSANT